MRTIRERTRVLAGALVAVVALMGMGLTRPGAAEARDYREGPRRDARFERHGDVHRFRDRDIAPWRGGHWEHTRHLGRIGWWWVVGGTWYSYPAPIYPYPEPYVVPSVPPAPPAAQEYWYYCQSAQAYYPYVTSCPGGWTTVVPSPAP